MLCGVKKNEFSIVSTSALADPFKRDWDWELIDLYGYPRRIFSPVVEPGTVLGPLLPDVALKTGLEPDVPVIAGAGHDTAAAIAAVPAAGSQWAYLSSGTWSLMGVERDQPLINGQALKYNFTNEGGVQKTVRFLKNILGLWPVQECRRCWAESGKSFSYKELTALAEKAGPAKAWIDLDDWRFAKAGDMPALVLGFLEETRQNRKAEPGFIIRVILESLAFSYHEKILEIEKLTGEEIIRLHAVGGGIQNELLTGFAADAIGREVIAGPIEGTIAGNIGVQAIATGLVSDIDDWRRIITESFELKTYQPQNSQYFIDNKEKYKSIKRKKNYE
jgi:rhamnulokinase